MQNQLIKDIQMKVESITINNDSELVNANELAREINKGIKDIKTEYKPLKDQTNKAHKEVVAQEKKALEPWNNAKSLLNKAIGAYMLAEEERRRKELEMAKEAEEIFGLTVEVKEKPDLGGTHLRGRWVIEITEPDAVPIKYGNKVIRSIDMKALREICRYEDGKAEIPGVKFIWQKDAVTR